MSYDLLVIGDEREGIECAIGAAQRGLRVAIVCPRQLSISLDVIREAVDQVLKSSRVTMESLRVEVARLARQQSETQRDQMNQLGIEVLFGAARFVSDSTVEITECGDRRIVSATEFVVACGTKSRQPASFQGDEQRILPAESLLTLKELPQSSIVIGAGTTGLAVAILLARLGVEVMVIDDHISLFDVCNALDARFDEIQSLPIAFRLGDEVIGTTVRSDQQATARLASGRVMMADTIVVCVGRVGDTEQLNLEEVGVGVDERGRLWCDHLGQTWSPRIVAVGKIVGFQSASLTYSTVS